MTDDLERARQVASEWHLGQTSAPMPRCDNSSQTVVGEFCMQPLRVRTVPMFFSRTPL
jgi:hypothetical protein